jgi:golgi SNAP receptor complex member 2
MLVPVPGRVRFLERAFEWWFLGGKSMPLEMCLRKRKIFLKMSLQDFQHCNSHTRNGPEKAFCTHHRRSTVWFEGMLTLNELLPEEKRRLHELERQIMELERYDTEINGTGGFGGAPGSGNGRYGNGGSGMVKLPPQLSDIRLSITEMSRRLDELDKLVEKESKTRRSDMKRRVQHLRSAYENLVISLENYDKRRYQKDYSLQKHELFGKYSNSDPEIDDLEMAESSSLMKSQTMLNDYLNTGRETLGELLSQRERLKSVQTKVFDILSLLGISNSIMRAVEKRDLFDRYLVFGGMAVTIVILFLVIFYLRS